MARFFNTTGPCNPLRHYFLAPQTRLRGSNLERYIRDEMYWVLHAPRQTGKTTFLQTWMRQINASGEAIACYVSVEVCQGMPEVEKAIPLVWQSLRQYAKDFEVPVPPPPTESDPGLQLNAIVKSWSELCAPKPLVILFDEVDTLEGPAMISFLRQLRGGFASRGVGKFPVSVALVGMRDLRDYLAHSKDGVPANPGSPFTTEGRVPGGQGAGPQPEGNQSRMDWFNIKQDSATLANFSRDDVVALLAQHTTESGQVFEPGAIEAIWYWTQGQPYLVNKFADICVEEITRRDVTRPITADMVLDAKEILIQARTTHLDALAERLKQPQVKRVIQSIFTGDTESIFGIGEPGTDLCLDLGLITYTSAGGFQIANPLYREILPRALNLPYQQSIPPSEFVWQNADGTLDMDALLKEFQRFWKRHSDVWELQADYTEAFPHLLLMAFLQRILNGGGRITREYAAGRGRMDLFVEFAGQGFVIEIKLVHPGDGRAATLQNALAQVSRYRATVGDRNTPTYIALFDRTPAGRQKSWEERLTWETLETESGTVTVMGA
ncbi:MAG: PD-(D/E)XK nuclease domain-containing protein [Fibrobacteres bacterium]|nr:PD-(D/E)XK nuclease domain-containing protein [Fibrobacterota bacterium]